MSSKNEEKKIKIIAKENPKRPKSRAHRKFAILMKFNGKPVKEFKAIEKKYRFEKRWPTNELRWNLKHGLISFC